MTPFYNRLPDVAGVGVERTADILGAALAVGAAGGVLAHAAATGVYQLSHKKKAEKAVTAPPSAYPPPPAPREPVSSATKKEEK